LEKQRQYWPQLSGERIRAFLAVGLDPSTVHSNGALATLGLVMQSSYHQDFQARINSATSPTAG
jgi:hypothetical protein